MADEWKNWQVSRETLEGIAPTTLFDPERGVIEMPSAQELDAAKRRIERYMRSNAASWVASAGGLTALLDQAVQNAEMERNLQDAGGQAWLCNWYAQQRWTDEDRFATDREMACEAFVESMDGFVRSGEQTTTLPEVSTVWVT